MCRGLKALSKGTFAYRHESENPAGIEVSLKQIKWMLILVQKKYLNKCDCKLFIFRSVFI